MGLRIKCTNLKTINSELNAETMEGTAQYVIIKTAELVNYDYNILYFDNKQITFSDVVPTIKSGVLINKSVIRNDIIYSFGALLCYLLDVLEGNSWQKRLNEGNSQNKSLILYSLIKEYSISIEYKKTSLVECKIFYFLLTMFFTASFRLLYRKNKELVSVTNVYLIK